MKPELNFIKKLKAGKHAKFKSRSKAQRIKRSKIKESRISKSLRKGLTKFLILFLALPCLGMTLFSMEDRQVDQIFELQRSLNLAEKVELEIDKLLDLLSSGKFDLVKATFAGETVLESEENLKFTDYIELTSQNSQLTVLFSLKSENKFISLLNIIKINIFLLMYFCFLKSIDSLNNKHLVDPLENLISAIDSMSRSTSAFEDRELSLGENINMMFLINKMIETEEKRIGDENSYNFNDINVIKLNILKMQELLSICFGIYGAHLLKKNIDSNSQLSLFGTAHKSNRIVGILEFSNFFEFCKGSEKSKLELFNTFALFVHEVAFVYEGLVVGHDRNKFIIAWHLPDIIEGETVYDKINLAFLCMINIVIKLRKKEMAVKRTFGLRVRTNLKVNYVLSIGECFEGPLGCRSKIDPGFVGPAVSFAGQLLRLSKEYGVIALFTDKIFSYLGNELKKHCRDLDSVSFEDSLSEIRLITIAFDPNHVLPSRKFKSVSFEKMHSHCIRKKNKFMKGLKRGELVKKLMQKLTFTFIFKNNPKMKQFLDTFNEAVDYYREGNWKEAYKMLLKCGELFPEDKPTELLLQVIEKRNKRKPTDWEGYRIIKRI